MPRPDLERLYPPRPDSSTLLVTVAPAAYSAAALARAVEDADAHLLNLNLTADTTADGLALVELRVSHRDPGSTARALERHGFEVVASEGADGLGDDEARKRALEALRILNV